MTFGDIDNSSSSHQLEHPLNPEVTNPLPMMFNIICSYLISNHLNKIMNYLLGREREFFFENSFDFLFEFALSTLKLGRSTVCTQNMRYAKHLYCNNSAFNVTI
jgi:hypothetical protein